jgi:hypothetical protein
MPISSWSTTPASNIATPPNGAPEGMAPSTVNDVMRQQMADHKTQWLDAEWFNHGDSGISRASATSFKITGDVTARYLKNRRIKCYDSSTIYGTITASSYSAPDTTITVETDSGSLTASLSSIALAITSPSGLSIPSTIGMKGNDVVSASTVDLSAIRGDFVDITGTTTITAFGTVAAGVQRTVRFTGALTLTHNATSLILPGNANITTASGDTAIFRSLGSGNWVCISYKKADGTPVVLTTTVATPLIVAGNSSNGASIRLGEDTDNGTNYIALKAPDSITSDITFTLPSADGSANQALTTNGTGTLGFTSLNLEKISTATASSSSSIIFTNLSSSYVAYVVIANKISPATDNVHFYLRVSTNNGASSLTSGYQWSTIHYYNGGANVLGNGTISSARISLSADANRALSNTANETLSGQVIIIGAGATGRCSILSNCVYTSDVGEVVTTINNGQQTGTTAINAVEFLMSSGNIASGTFILYGLRA